MILNKITLQGFKSFIKKQELNFNNYDRHFYFVTGENKLEPELGANGCGKSTLLIDSLCYVFFGKTANNLKASNVGSWSGDKGCEVSVDFLIGNKEYTLTRTWSPNTLILTNDQKEKTITQEDIENLIGMNFNSFLYSIVVSQFGTKFFDLTAGDKLSVFSDILKLDYWLKCSDKAKYKSKKIKDKIDNVEKDIKYQEGKISQLESVDYIETSVNWEINQKEKVDALLEDITESKIRIEEYKVIIEESKVELEKAEGEKKLLDTKIPKLKKRFNKLKDKIREYQDEILVVNNKVKLLDEDIYKFNSVEDECPYCNQKVPEKHLRDEIKEIEKEKKELMEYTDKLLFLREEIDSNNYRVESRLESHIEDSDYLKYDTIELVEGSIRYSKRNIEGLEKDNIRTINEIEKLGLEKNPYQELILKNKEQIEAETKKLKKLNDHFVELYTQYDLHNYWVKAFKDIRLFIIEESLKEFEIEINNIINKLGLFGWQVSLHIDSITKTKTIKKGFTVYISSPVNKELVPFDCWSGGESQRLRLAGTLALSSLIRNKTGNTNIIILDEPTQWLSQEGIEDLLGVLKDYCIDNDLTGFLIDHRNFSEFGCFDGLIEIIKDKSGSYVDV